MANTVSHITYSNTFAQWVTNTNQLIGENNDLATGSYYKNQGTLFLNSPVGLYVSNSAAFAGNTTFSGNGASFTVTNKSYFTDTTTFSSANDSIISVGNITTNKTLYSKNTNSDLITANTLNISKDFTVSGNVTIGGENTVINSNTVIIKDSNITIGNTISPTNITANGGGITLKGTTDKTFNWANSTGAWTSSEHLALISGKTVIFNGSTSGTVTVQPPVIAGTTVLSLPNTTGTLISTGDVGTITGAMIANSTIVDVDISPSAAIVYSKLSLANTIVNSDIKVGAAIDYAKLNLANNIVNADIKVGAAIDYAKLNLGNSIANTDISPSAAIVYSKLNLANNIVNADIKVGAAIATSKLAANTISGVYLGNNLNALTIGTGLTGTSYNGSSANTIAIDSTVALRSDTHYIGNTAVTLNRTAGNLGLTGISSISLPAGSNNSSIVLQPSTNLAIANTTVLSLPTANGTLISTGDTGTVTSSMISSGIATSKLAANTISGVYLGNNLNSLTIGTGLTGTSYNGSGAVTVAIDSTVALRSDTHYIGNTAVTLNRTAGNLPLTGISYISLPAGSNNSSIILQPYATIANANTTILTLPVANGTLISTGDVGTITGTMIANSTIVDVDISANAAIATSKLAANTISGVYLGNNLNALTIGTGLTGTSYNGSGAVTVTVDSTVAFKSNTIYIGNTAVTLNRTAGNLPLTGISSISLPSGSNNSSIILQPSTNLAIANTTVLNLPTANGTLVSTGDTGTVTSSMISSGIATSKLAANTISGVYLGNNLNSLTFGNGFNVGSYNGSGAVTINANVANTTLAGVVQLTDSVSSNSTTTAATPNSVKTTYDQATNAFSTANTKLASSGGTITGSLTVNQNISANSITADTFTVSKSFVSLGSTISDSNEIVLQASTGSNTSPSSYITVNRGAGQSNAAIKWDNTLNIWQIKNISAQTYSNIITQEQLGPVYDLANTKFSSAGGTISGNVVMSENLTVSGNLYVSGNTTSINATTVDVKDINITLGNTASPTDVTADGGGITVKGTTDKTFNWVSSSNSWTSSENINLAKNKSLILNGANTAVVRIQPPTANSNTTVLFLPTANGTLISTGDTGTVTSAMIADGAILDSDISPTAAIVYSKLNLANNIVNSDISPSAAIVYSKLNLANTIVNSDIKSDAAIAYSKLSLGNSIANTDISPSAAIVYSKLSLGNSIINSDISANAAIATSKLAASTISGVSLGNNLNALTIGSGLTGTSYNGSGAVTVTVDSTVAFKSNTIYIGNTAVTLNRTAGNLSLTGISSISLPSGSNNSSIILQPLTNLANANTTVLNLPVANGTLVSTGDVGSISSTMIIDGTILNSDINPNAAIETSKLAANTISGVYLGNSLKGLTFGNGFNIGSYDGSTTATITANTASTTLAGIVQLTDSVSSNSTTTAATPNSVKTTYDQANNAFIKANTALTVAQSSFGQANNGFTQANTALTVAQSSFGQANNGFTQANTALTVAQSSFGQANNGFTQANTALTVAQSSFDAANTKFASSGGAISGSVTISQDLTVSGNVTVQGTTTTLNSTTIRVNDKNIELANVSSPTNVTADGGGITLIGATNKTFNWANSTGAWTSSEHLATAAGKTIILNGATSGTITLQPTAVAGTTTLTLPATTGTLISTGDVGTITGTMIANSTIVDVDISTNAAIATSKLAANTISGVYLGNNLNALTFGNGFNVGSYNGSATATITANTASTTLAGVVQLTDSVSSTNTTTAATPNSVKTTYDQANNAFTKANTTLTVAQSSFGQANNGFTQANTALTVAQSSFGQANNGFTQANTALTVAQSSFGQANNGFTQANTALTVAQSAFSAANTKFASAGGTISGSVTISQDLSVSGNVSVTGFVSATDFNSLSDIKYKQNIRPVNNSIQIIKQLNPVEFDWVGSGELAYGFIAQELETVIPTIVKTDDTGTKTVAYTQLIAFLVDAIKDQQNQIDELKQKLNN